MSSSARENQQWVLVFCKEDESYTAVQKNKINGLPETGKELLAELEYFDPILSKDVSKKWLVTVIETGTEKEMKKRVPEFAARLKQAKEKNSLNEPRKRRPTEKVLEQIENLQNHVTLGEEEERKKSSKSKKKVKETDVGGEKENASKYDNDKALSKEDTSKSLVTGMEKNKSAKRKATANVGEEKHTKKAKKAKRSNETDAKIKASKEAAMKFFTDIEPEVTEVDVRQTAHLELSSSTRKEKGRMFRQMLNREYPEFSDDPDPANNLASDNRPAPLAPNNPPTSHLAPINNSSANHLAPHHPPPNYLVPNMPQSESSKVPTSPKLPATNTIMPGPSQAKSPSNHPTSILHNNIAQYSTLLRPELVSQLVTALQTVNSPDVATVVEDTGETGSPPEEMDLRNEHEEIETGCQKCKPIIDHLKQEVSELRGHQIPDSSSEIVCFLEKLLFVLKNGNQEIQVPSTFHGSPHVQQENPGKSGMTPLIPDSGVFIPTVTLGAILDQSNKDPNNLFHKLVEHFFSQHVLATATATSQRMSKSFKRPLDQNIVKAIEAFVMSAAKRWNAVPLTHAQIIKKLTNKCSAAERAIKHKLLAMPSGSSQDNAPAK